ncbi:acyltransferase [Acetobacterium wieringae]|uniref:Acyltransferase n=1 Tax=Acetobacterium wieringae TaxID=52694 RepID=A0A5D0WHD5_9FIRM|nr:acyltransferase [Acetobacterium wieringae]TYC82204.1 acyltransferase [Acetobacterium wieringae]
MKKYIRAIICFMFSLIKFCFIKMFHFKGFEFTPFNLFSPLTEIDLSDKSRFKLNKFVKARSGTRIKVRESASVEIGENTSFNHGCMIISHESIKIGKDVQVGPNVLIYDHDHDYRAEDGLKRLKYKTAPVEIGNSVWIGANVVILRGTVIGDNCVIGAGLVLKGYYENNLIITQERIELIKKYQKTN